MRDDYRLDIQGLRAIAILAVLIFHIDSSKLPGGYIGVDLFFVISGFLITGHIMRDLDIGAFSFKKFYFRRIRRLYPALFATLIASAIGVYLFYLPQDARVFGEALMATSVYGSNIYFYTQSDYFDAKLHTNPLLHTWSLSVEEQFYIIFPLLLFFLYKFARARLFWILAALGAVAFIISEIVLRLDASAAFFMMPTRFGQFVAGALIALAPAPAYSKAIREGMTWMGLALIGGSIVFMSGATPFPGFMSIIPTAGIAMMIYAGAKQDLFSGKLLALWPAQFFGKISYSLYLWHWPIILFYQYHFASEIRGMEKIIVGVACIAAGYLSWRFIEVPGLKMDLNRPYFYKAALAVSVAGIVIGGVFAATDGFKNRFNADELMISSYLDAVVEEPPFECTISSQDSAVSDYDAQNCLKVVPNKKNILLIGDSHADHLAPALRELFPNAHISQATSSGCRPLLDAPGDKVCVDFRNKLFKELIKGHHFDTILVSGRWRENEVGHVGETVEALKPYADKIVISGPVIEYTASLPKLMTLSLHNNDGGSSVDKSRKFDQIKKTDRKMGQEVGKTSAQYFSPFKLLCHDDGRTCRTEAQRNVPMQFDYGHLTKEGALIVVQDLKNSQFQGW